MSKESHFELMDGNFLSIVFQCPKFQKIYRFSHAEKTTCLINLSVRTIKAVLIYTIKFSMQYYPKYKCLISREVFRTVVIKIKITA